MAALIVLTVVGLFAVGFHRLDFNADVTSLLPKDDSVVADARYVFTRHPIHDRVVVDLSHSEERWMSSWRGRR